MSREFDYDAVVVGAGAMGAVFAHELTQQGMSVLCLEKGKHFKDHRADFVENELETFRLVWDYSDYEITGNAFDGGPNLGANVGGGTLAWTATALRFFNRDFRFKTHWGSPQGSNVADWPINKRMLRNYYIKAERQMGVSGEPNQWDEGYRTNLPNPPLPFYPSSRTLMQGFSDCGLHYGHGRVATNSQEYQGREACINCGFCRAGCRTDAKYQADKALIEPALETGMLTLETDTIVTRVETNRWGNRATGVRYINTISGQEKVARAPFIVLCNNPFEIPRLLLSSTSTRHPNGVGNNCDQIGRNFYSHATCIGLGLTNEVQNTYVGHSMCNIMSLDRCENVTNPSFAGGYSLMSLHGAGAGALASFPLHHLNGHDLKSRMRSMTSGLVLLSFIEGLPVYTNRVSVNRTKFDSLGMPLPTIHYDWHPNDLKAFEEAEQSIKEILGKSGSDEVFTSNIFESHPMGTMRMGYNPTSSATDRFGRVHGVRNLYVAGGCLFPTGSSVNPTLTMHALALRSSRKIINIWKRRRTQRDRAA